MKGLLFNINLRHLWVLFLIPFLTRCQKDKALDLSLAVNANELHLEAVEGSTNVMIYANGAWNVSFKEDVDWISVNKLSGTGNSDVKFSYSQNFGAARKLTMIITKGSDRQEIVLIQKGLDAGLRFEKTRFTLAKNALPTSLPIISNLKYSLDKVKLDYLYDDETSEKWISNAELTDKGLSFNALENNSGRPRSVRVYLNFVDGFGNEISSFADIDQSLDPISLAASKVETRLTKNAVIDTLILKGNAGVHFPNMITTVTYLQGAGNWIEQITLEKDSLLILAVRGNSSGLDRTAEVQIALAINGQPLVNLKHSVFQSAEDYDFYSFDDLRQQLAASGEKKLDLALKVLEGFVISDRGNANVETNPNLTFNTMDLEEAYKTAYVQSLDGKYGLRLKFKSVSENTLTRYSKIRISLDGLTLMKETSPDRYTIKGLTAGAIVKAEPGTPSSLPAKVKSITGLTDADLYTYVTIPSASVSTPYGSYTNVNVGYTLKTDWNTQGTTGPYTDAVPTVIFDEQGSNMPMLVNTTASWSRRSLPKGSGTVSGILVHSKLRRFGPGAGDIGRYAIRPLDEADIRLQGAAIAKTLVQWNWIKGGNDLSAAEAIRYDGDKNVLPAIGTGKLNVTVPNQTPSLGAHPIYHQDPNSKAVPSSALQYNLKWWNTSTNSGEGFVLRFSTAGVSAKHLLLNFSQGGGSGTATTLHVPTYWEVEYSLDGINYTTLPNSTYAVRPLAGWGLNHNFAGLGLTPQSFALPTQLLGQAEVFVKLKAKSNICAENTPDGAETGRITSSTNNTAVVSRLGIVSIEYIQ